MKRTTRPSTRYKKDLKRIMNNAALIERLCEILSLLEVDAPLPPECHDHALHNNWEGCRDCHIRPDVVLVYQKSADGIELLLLRVGSHSEVFR